MDQELKIAEYTLTFAPEYAIAGGIILIVIVGIIFGSAVVIYKDAARGGRK